MANKNDEFLKKLLATFRVEANEHLEAMSSRLIELEKAPAGDRWSEIIESIYREAHSLKGAARAVNFGEIESVCHALESVFGGLRGNRLAPSVPLFDLLQRTLDVLGVLLASDAQERPGAPKQAVAALIRQLDDATTGATPARVEPPSVPPLRETALPPPPSPAAAEPAATAGTGTAPSVGSGTIRVYTAKLDSVMRQTEELFAPRLAAGQRVQEVRETAATVVAWKRERTKLQPALRSIERSIERSLARQGRTDGAARGQRELTKLLEYLEAENLLLKTVESRLAKLERSAEQDHRAMTGLVDSLLHDVKEMHMMPFSSLLDLLPRLTRELARDQGKLLELVIRGGEIEIDRRILEEMKDPVNHLIRNCIDHGIEKPTVREQKCKPPSGTLTVAVAHKDSSKVEILIADDGAGIDVANVKAAAGRLGMVSNEELGKFDEQEALALVFRSGVSTSPIVTDLSGRGLGLAIVRERVERLGGTVVLETRPGAGTTFRITLPLTLATFRGVLVRAGDQVFIVPAVSVERVARVSKKDIKTVENRETIPLGGRTVSLVRLSDVLEIPRATDQSADDAQVVLLGLGPDRVAFQVDAVLGEQEVLVKGLGRQLERVRNIAGASVLGTGQVVAVLNVPDLMKSALKPAAQHVAVAPERPAETAKGSILVVEDSITSRALMKNILESAGYTVSTAVDGLDGYTTLKSGAFDLMVSDVEMPRMDGFDLTAKVRADKQLSELPVVLVTALESREHRERGIDVGANAYIVKSSFDQSNLLEIIRRMI